MTTAGLVGEGQHIQTIDCGAYHAFNGLGFQSTLQGATEGFANVPKLYGGEVREHKKVKGFGSGVVEGSKVHTVIAGSRLIINALDRDLRLAFMTVLPT